jgi:hypothetical protein
MMMGVDGKPFQMFQTGGGGARGTQDHRRTNLAKSTNVTVGVTSTLVLSANPTRLQAIMVNDSDTDLYIGFGSSAALNDLLGGTSRKPAWPRRMKLPSVLRRGGARAIAGSVGKGVIPALGLGALENFIANQYHGNRYRNLLDQYAEPVGG